jgi:Domain of unknown function (DUF4105)
MKRSISLLLFYFLFGFAASAKTITIPAELDSSWIVSVLTCTPGAELYSTFGHSAIRIRQEGSDLNAIDVIYNYGTFDGFQDNFVLKFARGKLEYCLSVESFQDFYYSYIQQERGVTEQTLNLSNEQKRDLFVLLAENSKVENRNYKYDFFYDNCATRIEQVLRKALGNGFEIKDASAGRNSFRDAIDLYLTRHPWGDYGIDLALGLPCDKKMEYGQSMFLPDSVFARLADAELNGKPLVAYTEEILMAEPSEYEDIFFTPLQVNIIWLVLCVIIGVIFFTRRKYYLLTDRITMFITGFVGLFLVFLWFFTDHTATAYNLNLLWANPVNLIIAFLPSRSLVRWKRYITVYMVVLGLLLILWYFLPQHMHLAVIPLIAAILFSGVRMMKLKIQE